MPPIDVVSWGELWFVQLGPVLLYLGTVWFSFQLHRKPGATHAYWLWSFLCVYLAVFGAMIVRVQSLFHFYQVGRVGAWEAMNPEHLVGAWCVGIGLFFHVLLLNYHPFWQDQALRRRLAEGDH